MSDWALAGVLFLGVGGVVTLNVLHVLEKVEAADTITIGPEQYPQCQVIVSSVVVTELGEMGMWDWMAHCIVNEELKGQNHDPTNLPSVSDPL